MGLMYRKAGGEKAPRGYGIAWREFDTGRAVCYPIGLNRVARWLRELWWWVAVPRGRTREEEVKREAYDRGYEDGVRMGSKLVLESQRSVKEEMRRMA